MKKDDRPDGREKRDGPEHFGNAHRYTEIFGERGILAPNGLLFSGCSIPSDRAVLSYTDIHLRGPHYFPGTSSLFLIKAHKLFFIYLCLGIGAFFPVLGLQ